ncbi:MAG: TonB-dependent receptor [bacterium]|nr:TonB-dependent receptor [bacterium]
MSRPSRVALLLLGATAGLIAQDSGRIEGRVVLAETGEPLHAATVILLELDRQVHTGDDGEYSFRNVPPGLYHLVAHVSSALAEKSDRARVAAGETATLDFTLGLAEVHEEITVTADGRTVTAFEAIQSTETRNSFQLAEEISPSLGQTLGNAPGNGIASRSFGPGTERPIIRGFDGDRVLVMSDGIRTGTLSSQSGDHGELVNTGDLDRIEVVRGPASLMYGGSAVGGVVNTISRHHSIHEHAHQGMRGFVSGSGGSASSFASGSAGFEYGVGQWMIWGGGSGQSSGDYSTPEGEVPNSDTRLYSGRAGFGYYGSRMFFALGGQYDEGVYGVPFANDLHAHEDEHEDAEEEEIERIQLDARRQNYRASVGLRNLSGAIQRFALRLNYSRWMHDEVERFEDGDSAIGTEFDNKQFVYRGTFEQMRRGPLTGRFGFWGMVRDYVATGEEALSPPVDQWGLAGFVLEELDYDRVKLQFGARLEHTDLSPGMRAEGGHGHDGEATEAIERAFTGASASAGANFDLWDGGAFVANYTHSYRPPALEELYNFGPHVGSLAFEVGDANLDAERGNGIDLSLRHADQQFRLTGNFFYYDFSNFVFPFATGETVGGLQEIEFTQSDARFLGTEVTGDLALTPGLWLNLGMDYVDAAERSAGTSLPRIPPLRGRVGLDWHWKGLEVKPELLLADRQTRTFTAESQTPGYTLFNIRASYSITKGRFIHQLAVNTFNLGDRLYRNHSSFIKNLAPEIGRGVRFTYRVRFF